MTETVPTSLSVDRYVAAPPERVWRALTEPELLARWWAPGDVVTEVGRTFHLQMPGWGDVPCTVLEAEAPERFVYTFAHWTLTWTLAVEDGGTRLHLEQTGFDPDSHRDRGAFDRMGPGWRDTVLPRLDEVVGTL